MKADFMRPVSGTLMVMLPGGEMWEATDEDLRKFGLAKWTQAYHHFDDHLTKVLAEAGLLNDRHDLTKAALNPLRYLAEVSACYPDLLTHPEMSSTNEDIVKIEEALIAAGLRDED